MNKVTDESILGPLTAEIDQIDEDHTRFLELMRVVKNVPEFKTGKDQMDYAKKRAEAIFHLKLLRDEWESRVKYIDNNLAVAHFAIKV